MKLTKILTENLAKGSPAFMKVVNKLKEKGGTLIGSGDYGNVYQLGDKVIKVTTDEVELEHAEILKGKNTKHFVKIFGVKILKDNLGIITMQNMDKLSPSDEIDEDYVGSLHQEAESLGIDPDELDMWVNGDNIKRDNFMKDPSTGQIKMVDV